MCRYLGRLRESQALQVQPPFLRPQLSEAQLAAKVLDNGIQQVCTLPIKSLWTLDWLSGCSLLTSLMSKAYLPVHNCLSGCFVLGCFSVRTLDTVVHEFMAGECRFFEGFSLLNITAVCHTSSERSC